MMLDADTLAKLHKLGLIETAADGSEGVRVSVQCRSDLAGQNRQQRRETLERWVETTATKLARFGAAVRPESLSVMGQTVEAVIPISKCETAEREFAKTGERLDVVMAHQAVQAR